MKSVNCSFFIKLIKSSSGIYEKPYAKYSTRFETALTQQYIRPEETNKPESYDSMCCMDQLRSGNLGFYHHGVIHLTTKSRNREIGYYAVRIALEFARHLDNAAAFKISGRLEKSKAVSRGFKSSRDFAIRRPSARWILAMTKRIKAVCIYHGIYCQSVMITSQTDVNAYLVTWKFYAISMFLV